ncbi:MAG: hypothetical protein HYT65_01650 [Candidatus Yanofskybacteria bacterium]|nr:hypothetical protein [Candidatus Yanofskybacteria bacterium]
MGKNRKTKPPEGIGTLINRLIDLKLRQGNNKDFEAVLYGHQKIGQIVQELNLQLAEKRHKT